MPAAFALLLVLLGGTVCAEAIYQCGETDGVPLFSNAPCDPDSAPLPLPPLGIIGSDDGGASLNQRLERIRAQPDPEPVRRQRSKPAKRPLGFSERITLRKLEIRRDGLEKDVRKGSLSEDYRASLRRELNEVKRQLRALRARQQ